MARSKAVETTESTPVVSLLDQPSMEQFRVAAEKMRMDETTGDEVIIQQIQQLFNATEVDDILEDPNKQATLSLDDYLGMPFTIHRAKLTESDFKSGLAAYLVMWITFDGETKEYVLTCGAQTVIAQVVRANDLGKLPMRCIGKKADKATRAGYWPLSLARPPAELKPRPDQEESF